MCKYFGKKNLFFLATIFINNFGKLSKTKTQTAHFQRFAFLRKPKSCPKQKVINNSLSIFIEI